MPASPKAKRSVAQRAVAPRTQASRLSATKGEETRAAILEVALKQASTHGYESLTIGSLAEATGLSKSGLFAHFGSKEDLQIATLDEGVRRYNQTAFLPALAAPRGLKRLRAFFEHWLLWTERGALEACPLMAGASEFGSRTGPMRDAIEAHMRRLHLETIRAVEMVIAAGDFRDDIDADQFAFELFGIFATYYRARNLFKDSRADDRARAAFERLVAACTHDHVSPILPLGSRPRNAR